MVTIKSADNRKRGRDTYEVISSSHIGDTSCGVGSSTTSLHDGLNGLDYERANTSVIEGNP